MKYCDTTQQRWQRFFDGAFDFAFHFIFYVLATKVR
jgi:hypothetical protein